MDMLGHALEWMNSCWVLIYYTRVEIDNYGQNALSKGICICTEWDMNPRPSDYKSRTQTTRPQYNRTYLADLNHVIELVDGFLEGGAPDLTRLVQEIHREELSFAPRVAPGADRWLVGHPRLDGPSSQETQVLSTSLTSGFLRHFSQQREKSMRNIHTAHFSQLQLRIPLNQMEASERANHNATQNCIDEKWSINWQQNDRKTSV